MEMAVGLRVDRGRRRRRNEDRALACVVNERDNGGPACLLAVADGMGGMPGGDVASEVAVRALEEGFHRGISADAASGLRMLVQAAHTEVQKKAALDLAFQGMGTTLVAALVARNALWVANVGDSRAYLVRDGSIRQLTEDHSWVEEQVKAGHLSRVEAAKSPQRNIVTQSLGSTNTVKVDIFSFGLLKPDDILLLCSDGLYNAVPRAEILAVASSLPPQEAADRLVDLANANGGSDNIAVVVARWERNHSRKAPSEGWNWAHTLGGNNV